MYFFILVALAVLFPHPAVSVQAGAIPHHPDQGRRLAPKRWVDTNELGIRHCAIQGDLTFVRKTARGNLIAGPGRRKNGTFILHIWTRMKFNATHMRVRSSLALQGGPHYKQMDYLPHLVQQF
jgi:hypothetical protein